MGADLKYEILSVVPWTRRELVADRYRDRRVFLCGDSAHVMSPTGGFGMNTGIGDAIDLSWKLEAIHSGWGTDRLLDSYDLERRPVAIRNSAEASKNLRKMRVDMAEAAAQGGKIDYVAVMSREWRTHDIQLGYEYDTSPVCVLEPTGQSCASEDTYQQTARPGARAPHVWLEDGRSTLDLFGQGFVLLRFGPSPPSVEPFVMAARKQEVPLTVIDLAEPSAIAAYGRKLVLVRPDGHVAWRGDAMPSHPERLVKFVRGALVE